MKLEFRKEEESRANKFYILVEYAGGDADTDHPEEYDLTAQGITYQNYKEKLPELQKMIEEYKILKDVLDEYSGTNIGREEYKEIEENYGEEMASMVDNTPNDPQCDFQFKCYLDYVHFITYDERGTKYKSNSLL